MIIGIDPGVIGGIAFMEQYEFHKVIDMPIMSKTVGKGNQVNPYELCNVLSKGYISKVFLEVASPMAKTKTKQGVTSMFSFGKTAGIIEGVIAGLKIPVVMIHPMEWKSKFGLVRREKDVARTVAMQLYPEAAGALSRKKDCGRADAILIAHYGMMRGFHGYDGTEDDPIATEETASEYRTKR